MRTLIGVLGIAFPLILVLGNGILHLLEPAELVWFPSSISDFHGTRMQDWYSGILFVLGFFLLAYKGYGRDNWVANLGCLFAVATAVFDSQASHVWMVWLHFLSALGLFAVFIVFSLLLFPQSKLKRQEFKAPQRRRNLIYALSGWSMVILIAALILCFLLGLEKVLGQLRLVFWVETLMLWSFGIAWLTKGQQFWLKDDQTPCSSHQGGSQSLPNVLEDEPEDKD
jgi:hypothetical protein